MLEDLTKIIKNLKGTVMAVTLKEEILKIISSNKKIDQVYTLDHSKVFNKIQHNKKRVKMRKIKKEFKSKLDNMIVDVNGANIDLNKIINNTYKLVDKKIIFYGIYDEYDVDKIAKKYERYNCTTKKKMYDDSFILEVDVKKIKLKHVVINIIIDVFIDVVDAIGNLLLS